MSARVLPFRRPLGPAPPHIARKDYEADPERRFTKFGPDFDRYLEAIRQENERPGVRFTDIDPGA